MNRNSTLLIVICVVVVGQILAGCIGSISVGEKEAAKVESLTTDELSAKELPEDEFSCAMNPERDYLIVVNDDNPYDFEGEYNHLLQDDLVYVADVLTGDRTPVEKAAYYAFTELQYALDQKGMRIGLYSAYRTEEDQQAVCDYYGSLEDWADKNKIAKPGYSEHHTGLLLNILIYWPDENGEMVWHTETAERQVSISEFKVVHETLADYGFIDRYPEGKEPETGYPCEPYEIRFVGSSKVAHEIMDNGLCLEEYLKQKSN
ncbi:D-alanyl-D-alanine carboxypeptidase family protein [Candidatus Saccharibacteria bacterium]|nr:D-alanyl-D-alanine carboxypeptidase family protein [Candidatus Saccharibacteria bacterium]